MKSLALLELFVLTIPVLASGVRCTTYAEKALNRVHTLCDDGTRAISQYQPSLKRWQTTITETPRKACKGQMNTITKQIEVRCR